MEQGIGEERERDKKMLEVHNHISYDEGPSAVLNGQEMFFFRFWFVIEPALPNTMETIVKIQLLTNAKNEIKLLQACCCSTKYEPI